MIILNKIETSNSHLSILPDINLPVMVKNYASFFPNADWFISGKTNCLFVIPIF